MRSNIVIIGGGASGMCAAILIKRQLTDCTVTVIEGLDRVCKKLIVTGNGRCNITNKYLQCTSYYGENSQFCKFALNKYGYNFTEDFFGSIGIPFCEGESGKVYPFSLQASSVVDALRLEVSRLNVNVVSGVKAEKILPQNNGYKIICDSGEFCCDNVIVATGGVAGGIKLGCTGSGYKILKELGFGYVNTTSALVQLKTETKDIKALGGIKINAEISAFVDEKKIRTENGELLFTSFGISGPPVLQISRFAEKCKGHKTVKINMLPDFSYNEVVDMLTDRVKTLADRKSEFFFTGVFPKMVGLTILKKCGIKLTDTVKSLTSKNIREFADCICNFTLKVTGTKGFENAQVTAGGISTNDFDEATMESKRYKGLYAIGEVLDVDGDCGGFNLQWAWSSAACAAEGIVSKYK
ncbi:MAG: aminoacetone oxidase family FAD-binding enzyme [Acutalibacteraceae bacterium]|nr:aminoacetone oxidase family FAD-binding enzyme [Acutalibacteraceae bacterium]